MVLLFYCFIISAAFSPDQQQKQKQQQGGSGADADAGTGSLSIEILDTPSFIQAESYRSCAHLGNHVHEQMLRYVDIGTLLYFLVFYIHYMCLCGHYENMFIYFCLCIVFNCVALAQML